MFRYSYKAIDSEGKILRGILEAAEKKEVVGKLHELGYTPITILEVQAGASGSKVFLLKKSIRLFQKVSTKDVLLFTQDLSSLLEAGLQLDRALAILMDVAGGNPFKEIIKDVLKTVRGGSYLSDALGKHPKIFSPFYANMVRAGEVAGALGPVLGRLGNFLESSQDLKDYTKSVMVYPAFLVAVGGVSIIILLTYVIPQFSMILADMGQSIPVTTRLLLSFSNFIKSYWWAIAGVLVVLCFFLWSYLKTPSGQSRVDHYQLKLPLVAELVKNIEVARFARTLGTLSKSGVPILQALSLVKEVIRNRVMARALERIWERVKEGERLSKPLGETRIFPSLAVQMIVVGEETGKLDEMLLRVAETYEKSTTRMIRRIFSLLEPVTILVMGLVVGFIVISMLMGIFSMSEIPF